jgi:hypothetical protein
MKRFEGQSIAVDIDSTLLIGHYDYPDVGTPNMQLIDCLNRFHDEGGVIVLNTLREGDLLPPALNLLNEAGLKYDYVNENISARIEKWGADPRKIAATYYMDDRNIDMLSFMKLVDFKGEEN